MDTALDKSLSDVAKCLFEHLNKHDNNTTKLHQDDTLDGPVMKRQKISVNEPKRKKISLRRGQCYVNNRYGTNMHTELTMYVSHCRLMMPRLYVTPDHPTPPKLTLDVSWKVDTQKCVDASPLVVLQYDVS